MRERPKPTKKQIQEAVQDGALAVRVRQAAPTWDDFKREFKGKIEIRDRENPNLPGHIIREGKIRNMDERDRKRLHEMTEERRKVMTEQSLVRSARTESVKVRLPDGREQYVKPERLDSFCRETGARERR